MNIVSKNNKKSLKSITPTPPRNNKKTEKTNYLFVAIFLFTPIDFSIELHNTVPNLQKEYSAFDIKITKRPTTHIPHL